MARSHHTSSAGALSVLLVDHTATISGAEVSLLDLIAGLGVEHRVTVAVPQGSLADAARAVGATVREIPAVEGSLRLDPTATLFTLGAILRAAVAIRRAARVVRADVVHANSFRAGLAACLAAGLGAPRPLVHIRDCLPASRAAKATQRVLSRSARTIIANSAFTAACFDGAPAGAPITVVHNPIDLNRFNPERIDRARARAEHELAAERIVLVVLAQITPWKGQDTAIHATRLLLDRGYDVELLIAGSVKFRRPLTRYDNDAYLQELHAAVDRLHLEDAVRFEGEVRNAPSLLRAADYVLVPSWAEPWGRVIAEAMAMGTPVIATNAGGPTELIDHAHNGLLVPPRDPAAWADAIERLIGDPELHRRMTDLAHKTARRFDRDTHVEAILKLYREAAAGRTEMPLSNNARG